MKTRTSSELKIHCKQLLKFIERDNIKEKADKKMKAEKEKAYKHMKE